MRFPILLLAAVLAIAGFGYLISRDSGTANAAPRIAELDTAFGPASFTEARARADDDVATKRKRLATAPDQWLHEEGLASALFGRFSLSGERGDLVEARDLLEDGLRRAPNPSGPTLTLALVALADHDLDRAATALDRFDRTAARRTPVDRSEAAAMRGDIAFQRGDLAEAKAHFARADADAPSFGTKLRLANAKLWSGDAQGARQLAENAMAAKDRSPMGFADAALLMANLSYAQGDLPRAQEWIAAARNEFDGYWLADAYAAQTLAATGEGEEAVARLTKLAQKTGEPDVMDVLTGVLLHRGETASAERWSARAGSAWEARMVEAREAYRLHAAEHYLDFGDPARALVLAREEVAARPFGEAIEVLASALTATGRPEQALAWLERAEADGWRAVSLDLARSDALEALGQKREARRYLDRARAVNPMAGSEERKLIRFGHF